jgi:EAL domain-containing protein (putative c-di-GMP-specific phosphodiesterase class I)
MADPDTGDLGAGHDDSDARAEPQVLVDAVEAEAAADDVRYAADASARADPAPEPDAYAYADSDADADANADATSDTATFEVHFDVAAAGLSGANEARTAAPSLPAPAFASAAVVPLSAASPAAGPRSASVDTPIVPDRAPPSAAVPSRADAQGATVRRLLEDGRLRVHYQPQVSTANGTIVGVEALVRWEDDEAALRAAGELFGDGTSADSFSGATEFVLRRACADRRDWMRQIGRTLPVSVNVGLAELRDPGFIPRVLRILEEADLPAAYLEFEVPERALAIPGSPETEALEHAYRSGIGIAIGGFVAADAPLRALTQIPVAKLKLHRSLVADLPDDTHARMVVDAVLAIGRTLNVAVCAEGVERPAQAAYLELRECPVVQGWHYARSMDADQFFALMKGSGVDTVRLPLMDVEELEAHARAAGVV